jgi:nucleoside-diphosphate-sugar epimerase
MNAAVTGGTGFLGQALLRLLLAQAETVRVLVRRPEDEERMLRLGARPIRGDLTAMGGCDGLVGAGDIIFHAAARVDVRGRRAEFRRTTIEGTRRLLEAALPRKPGRFVFVSSAAVYLCRQTMNAPLVARPVRYNLYARAKLAAECVVRRECEAAGCPWTILRLGFLYGPGNRAMQEYFVPLLERDRLYVVGNGNNRIATLYVGDAARALVLAGSRPVAAGKIYDVASDEPVTQRQFVAAMAAALDRPPPRRHIGRRLAHVIAWAANVIGRPLGREPLFNRATVDLMSMDQYLDATRIRREVGWRPEMSFEDGMRHTRQWCREMRIGPANRDLRPCQTS